MLTFRQSPQQPPLSTTPFHPEIFTIGHGTRTLADLIDLLRAAGVTTLVDVRSTPRSRTNPQFNQDALISSPALRKASIDYVWLGDKLGGFRKAGQPDVERHTAIRTAPFKNYAAYMATSAFRQGLEELKDLAERRHGSGSGEIAIMCSETLWWRCHRRMIADMLVVTGWNVQHLGIKKDQPVKHVPWEIARLDGGGNLIYDVEL